MATKEKNSVSLAVAMGLSCIEEKNPDIAAAIRKELHDQRNTLKMIASENYSSLTTQLAMGNWLTDKYSEGYAHHRFYSGCDNVDTIEDIAATECKRLFGCDHAYVQPHSGADANLIAFWAILVHRIQDKEVQRLGKKNIDELSMAEFERIRQLLVNQKVMGMALGSGGHLTHGFRHNLSAKMMQAVTYDVDPETGYLDYDALAKQVKEEKPLILIAGYSAYPRLIDFSKMREIADSVGAVLMVDMAHFAGLVAGKVLTNEFDPIPYADIVTSTTHKTLRGPRGGLILCTDEYRDVVNKGCPLAMGGPLPHVMAAKAVAFREANQPEFKEYAKQIIKNSKALALHLLSRGVDLVTGGTDNHLIVFNVARSFGLTGRQAEAVLRDVGITTNRNAIPFDEHGAWYTSGIRIGTPALTSRGFKETDMKEIGDVIVDLLSKVSPTTVERTGAPSRVKFHAPESVLAKAGESVAHLLKKHPLYSEIV